MRLNSPEVLVTVCDVALESSSFTMSTSRSIKINNMSNSYTNDNIANITAVAKTIASASVNTT